jgi:Gpi18-like mannosyltransferase
MPEGCAEPQNPVTEPADPVTEPEVTGEAAGTAEAAPAASLFSLKRALVVAVLARLLTFVAAGAAVSILGVNPASWALRYPRRAEVFHGVLGNFLNPWAHWDGVWFIKVAVNGYAGNDGSAAFFPLFPLLLRWVGVALDNNLVIAGIVISLACYVGAMVLLYRLVEAEFDQRTAYLSVLYISLFPTAFFFQAVYSESLFLLLALACFGWSRSGRWKLAGLAGLFATLTRSTGIMLLLPMAYYYFRDRGYRPRRIDAKAASLIMIPEGLMVWMAYLSLGFHSPLLFAQVQDQWRRFLAPPNYALWQGLQGSFRGVIRIIWGPGAPLLWPASNPGAEIPLAIANLIACGAV